MTSSDAAIKQDIDRPAATALLLAASAISNVEFSVLVRRLQEAVADGSVLDYELAGAKAMRAFRCAAADVAAPAGFASLTKAHDTVAGQTFLASRLLAAAEDIVHEAGAGFDGKSRAIAVGEVLFSVCAVRVSIPDDVMHAIPADEWQALLASRKACWEDWMKAPAEAA